MNSKNLWIYGGALALIALVVAYYFGSRTGKAKSTVLNEAGNAANEINTAGLSYDLSVYDQMANKIYEAVSGVFTTDEQAVYSEVSRLRTKDDVLQTIKAFGSRGFFGFKGTFTEWIYQSMSSGEIEQINTIFTRNNIDFKL